MKSLACVDMGIPACGYVAKGETDKEVMDKLMNHGKTVHPDMVDKMDKDKMTAMMMQKIKTLA